MDVYVVEKKTAASPISYRVIGYFGSDPAVCAPELRAKQKDVLACFIPCTFMVMSEITQQGGTHLICTYSHKSSSSLEAD